MPIYYLARVDISENLTYDICRRFVISLFSTTYYYDKDFYETLVYHIYVYVYIILHITYYVIIIKMLI